ncbi:MAG: tetratricopeptide (TPR) repeat protein, partial [Arenicella sp.]
MGLIAILEKVNLKKSNILSVTLKILSLFLVCSLGTIGYSQNGSNTARIDSLIQVFINLEETPEKVDVLNEIANLYVKDDFILGVSYGNQALELANTLDYQDGVLESSLVLSHIQTNYYLNYFEGLDHLGVALEIAESKRDQPLLMSIYSSYGFIKFSMGDSEEGLRYYNKAIKIAQLLGDNEELASIYSSMGDIYFEEGDNKLALNYFKRVFNLYEQNKIDKTNPNAKLSIGMYYRLQGQFKEAI